MSITELLASYKSGQQTPKSVITAILHLAKTHWQKNIWTHLLTEKELQVYLDALALHDSDSLPLWGIPFAVKDNIDLANIATTAACPAFRHVPSSSATVVKRLIAAGAIPIGKTNLDQFATGLNGTRSPYGVCHNAFDDNYISGGSSSGSAVAVALGMASFSLGTDTAGSGRVPAAFNGLLGLKPSLGLLPTSGVLPACRSLDCVSIFAHHADDANLVLAVAEGVCDDDAYSRANRHDNSASYYGRRVGKLKIGVLAEEELQFFGDEQYRQAYQASIAALGQDDIEWQTIDYRPFDETARLLYEGPWVSERYLAIEDILENNPKAVFPVVRDIINAGKTPLASTLFKAQYRLQALQRACDEQLKGLDAILTPTAGRHFSIAEILTDPIRRNSELGYYTNFMNLLDYSAVALPALPTANGLPFGITLFATAFHDRALLAIANRWQSVFAPANNFLPSASKTLSDTPVKDNSVIPVLVCGAHLSGFPLNHQLTSRGAQLLEQTTTAPCYRFYVLAGGPLPRPALVRDGEQGAAIKVEIWAVPSEYFGSFVAGIPAPLGIGKVELADGAWVSGFICEPAGLAGAQEITALGSWQNYMAQVP